MKDQNGVNSRLAAEVKQTYRLLSTANVLPDTQTNPSISRRGHSSCTMRCRLQGTTLHVKTSSPRWTELDVEERFGHICHGLAHVDHDTHTPEFWSTVTTIYHTLHDRMEHIADYTEEDIHWSQLREFLVNDPSTATVDTAVETTYERRQQIADSVNYLGTLTPFRGVNIRSTGTPESTLVPLDEVTTANHTVSHLCDYLRTAPENRIKTTDDEHLVQPLPVEKQEQDYHPVSDDEPAVIAERAGLTGIHVVSR